MICVSAVSHLGVRVLLNPRDISALCPVLMGSTDFEYVVGARVSGAEYGLSKIREGETWNDALARVHRMVVDAHRMEGEVVNAHEASKLERETT